MFVCLFVCLVVMNRKDEYNTTTNEQKTKKTQFEIEMDRTSE
jgi:hypothetical protein